jgi:hypothetical protein
MSSNFLYSIHGIITGVGLALVDYSAVRKQRPVPCLLLATFLANAVISISNISLNYTDRTELKYFLLTLYQLSDIFAIASFEVGTTYRLQTLLNLIFGTCWWISLLWISLAIPFGYSISHVFAIIRLYNKSFISEIDFNAFHSWWHMTIAVYNMLCHVALCMSVHYSFRNSDFLKSNFKRNKQGPSAMDRLKPLMPFIAAIFYLAASIWSSVQPKIGVAIVWLAFAMDNVCFYVVNALIIKYMIAESSSATYSNITIVESGGGKASNLDIESGDGPLPDLELNNLPLLSQTTLDVYATRNTPAVGRTLNSDKEISDLPH